LCVNLGGCLLMGFVMQLALGASAFSAGARLAITTGFLGGLTTYSSFNYETTKLAQGPSPSLSLVNLAATLFGCLLAGLAGAWLGRRLAA
jgi:CrcB protein